MKNAFHYVFMESTFFCKYECPHVCISECRRRSEVTWRAEGRAQVLLLILLLETGSLLSSPTLYTRWSSLWASVDCPVSASHLTHSAQISGISPTDPASNVFWGPKFRPRSPGLLDYVLRIRQIPSRNPFRKPCANLILHSGKHSHQC